MRPTPLRLIVTGSRNWTNEDYVWLRLTEALWRAEGRPMIVVQGGCPSGPDRFAMRWVLEHSRWGTLVEPETFEADWSQGPSEGFRRNERMVSRGAWGVLGFVADCIKPDCNRPRPHGSHGTMHCLKVAKAKGLPIRAWKTKGWQGA